MFLYNSLIILYHDYYAKLIFISSISLIFIIFILTESHFWLGLYEWSILNPTQTLLHEVILLFSSSSSVRHLTTLNFVRPSYIKRLLHFSSSRYLFFFVFYFFLFLQRHLLLAFYVLPCTRRLSPTSFTFHRNDRSDRRYPVVVACWYH